MSYRLRSEHYTREKDAKCRIKKRAIIVTIKLSSGCENYTNWDHRFDLFTPPTELATVFFHLHYRIARNCKVSRPRAAKLAAKGSQVWEKENHENTGSHTRRRSHSDFQFTCAEWCASVRHRACLILNLAIGLPRVYSSVKSRRRFTRSSRVTCNSEDLTFLKFVSLSGRRSRLFLSFWGYQSPLQHPRSEVWHPVDFLQFLLHTILVYENLIILRKILPWHVSNLSHSN